MGKNIASDAKLKLRFSKILNVTIFFFCKYSYFRKNFYRLLSKKDNTDTTKIRIWRQWYFLYDHFGQTQKYEFEDRFADFSKGRFVK